jgi:uncharacterized protein
MSGLRIDVTDLLARTGARREVTIDQVLDDLHGSSARIETPIHVDLVLERIPDGVVARGSMDATWQAQCSVCLRDLEQSMTVDVDELFETDPVEGETYPLEGVELDLEQVARDALILELPLAPHCDTPCAPAAVPPGVVLTTASDGPAEGEPDETDDPDVPRDPRWSALSELEL